MTLTRDITDYVVRVGDERGTGNKGRFGKIIKLSRYTDNNHRKVLKRDER